ncbi:MAG: MBL fold metallo-hydrolase [Planctomycetota bacterium]|nr:MBL fold metallo-hydrolase [Planctomycetota bacterium]
MNENPITRRELLNRVSTAGLAAAAWRIATPSADAASTTAQAAQQGPLARLSEHLAVFRGPVNVGIVLDDGRALLVDCGDGRVAQHLPQLGVRSVEQIVFTHHHRDQACGAPGFVESGARLVAPAAERDHFAKVDTYWNDPARRWHLYNLHPHHLILTESVQVDAAVSDGQSLSWGPASIQVLATPGHTDGSVSYLVEVDGQRVIFCGDAIWDEGRLWELSSLQKGITTTDYHGFLGAREQLAKSLLRIKDQRPDRMVPSHGHIMDKPTQAIDALCRRLETCYDKYVAISALRHYFPKMFADYAGRPGHMPIRPGKPVPACLRHFGTSWVLISEDRSAVVMDCGSPDVIKKLKELLAKGEIRRIEGLWVTHYHDDHVDAIPAFQQAFDCPCITDRSVAQVISNPLAWRLPCISPSKVRVDRVTRDGETWNWHEFRLTAYHFPGQTLYHGGLLAESGDLRMLFVGDSFTPAGIDDYCAQNRIWLGAGVGFDRCLELIEKIRPTHLFNCHVDQAWDFTAEQCRFMRANLAEREKLYKELFPWDHPNHGMDESWVRCHPYEQNVKAGETASLRVVVTNHSSAPRTAMCRAVLPRAMGWTSTDWAQAEIAAKAEGSIELLFKIPADVRPGRYVVAVDLRYHMWDCPQIAEAILVV